MGQGQDQSRKGEGPAVVSSAQDFFIEIVQDALCRRRMQTKPQAQTYLVQLLDHYMLASNFFHSVDESGKNRQQPLAEMYFQAANAEPSVRIELLKKLGDTSLYVSGFFGDSLHRKLIDIDYYADMGGSAYGWLSKEDPNDLRCEIYADLSRRFLDYMEILTYISQRALVQTNEDILRLYNRYLTTGSELAREQLIAKGVLAPNVQTKSTKQ